MKKLAIGVDIGGINTAFGLVDENGDLYAESVISTKKYPYVDDYPAYVEDLCDSMRALAQSLSFEYELTGIGIGAPNANYHKGTIETPANLWKFKEGDPNPDESRRVFPLADDISKCFGGVKTLITNDANAATIGEMIYGNAKGMRDFIMITLGTGLGSGFVANGEMVYGHDGFAGEFGHVIVERNGRECGCGRRGCLETYVSATGIKRTAFELMAKMNAPSKLRSIAFDDFDASMISAAAEQGDPIALEAFRYTGEMLGRALADVVTVNLAPGHFPLRRTFEGRQADLRTDAVVHGGEHALRLQEQGETASQRHSGQECRHPRRLGADLAGSRQIAGYGLCRKGEVSGLRPFLKTENFKFTAMKRFFLLTVALLTVWAAAAQMRFVDATELNLIGKALPTPHPYHRIDTVAYKGFTKGENQQVRCSAGLALVFKTNSTRIDLEPQYTSFVYAGASTPRVASEGFDLYIRKDGEWLYAASRAPKKRGEAYTMISRMDSSEKECLLYLPNYSELTSLRVGVDEGATITPMENPFRHKIVIFGSSFTHGVSTSRAGMSYPMQIGRNTGLCFCSIACSGNCKLQPYFADYLGDVKDADAMVFDAFSNPDAKMIEERLIPFIERIRAKLPSTPLIFVQTIYRESGNFDLRSRKIEEDKRDMARRQMAEAMKRFDNVYFVDKADLTGTDHVTSADGTHPSDLGYWRWAQNLQPELLKVFRKCGIR